MPTFQILCTETDEQRRRVGILKKTQEQLRKKVWETVLGDETVQSFTFDWQWEVISVIYHNVLWKVILTLDGISMTNSSGETWAVT